jgi:hypothetical protein
MRSQDFSYILRTFADVLNAAGARAAYDQIIMFSAAFDADPKLSVSTLLKRVTLLTGSGHAGSPSLGDVARLLSALEGLFRDTAKSGVLNDLKSVERLLRDRASMEISAFVSITTGAAAPLRSSRKLGALKLRYDLIVHYKERLEESLGDEEKFASVYNDLRANESVGKGEIVALAKRMTGSGARSAETALKKIWNRHRSLLVFKAKSRATGGRSAA